MDFTAVIFDTLGPNHREELAALYDRCFPVSEGSSFLDDFPVWDPALRVEGRAQLGLRSNGRLVASASIRFAKLKPSLASIGFVGAVVTDPEHRGHGLASRAIEGILESAKGIPIQALVLWGSEKNLYGKFGFEYGGLQNRVRLGDLRFQSSSSDSKLEILDGWHPEIGSLMDARPDGLLHRESDHGWLSRHRNTLFFRLKRDGKCTAFAAAGRGIDLTQMVHDWGGEERDLGLLLSVIAREDPELQILYHPSHEARFRFLSGIDSKLEERLCMVKRIDETFEPREAWFYGLDSC